MVKIQNKKVVKLLFITTIIIFIANIKNPKAFFTFTMEIEIGASNDNNEKIIDSSPDLELENEKLNLNSKEYLLSLHDAWSHDYTEFTKPFVEAEEDEFSWKETFNEYENLLPGDFQRKVYYLEFLFNKLVEINDNCQLTTEEQKTFSNLLEKKQNDLLNLLDIINFYDDSEVDCDISDLNKRLDLTLQILNESKTQSFQREQIDNLILETEREQQEIQCLISENKTSDEQLTNLVLMNAEKRKEIENLMLKETTSSLIKTKNTSILDDIFTFILSIFH